MSENRITIGIKAPLARAASQNDAAIKVGNYSYYCSDQIGLGYISHVYLGRNDHTGNIFCYLGELVAIKVIDFAKEDELGQRLILEELAILEEIRRHHPQYLLLLHQHFRHNRMLYIVTEFCEGKDVAKALRKKKKIGEGQAQSIMKQLMQAYRQVHSMGIIHRDLKLANVLVQNGRLKLADFGFSIKEEKLLTEKNDYNVGSPYYMPPETLKHNKYSFLSDIWAFGVMAFEMVYGKLPWREKIESVLYEKIMQTNIEDLFDPAVPVSEHYKQFIRACLQVPIERRASPEFVIQYTWPMASDYLEGLSSEPGTRPLSMLRDFGTFTTRQIASHHHIPENNHSTQNSFSKNQPLREKSPNFLNKAERHRGLQLSNGFQAEKTVILGKAECQGIAAIIISQINYCRFIMNLIELAGSIDELGSYLNSLKVNCLRQLYKVKNGFPSNFSQLANFQLYKQTEQWQILKQIICDFTQVQPLTTSQEQTESKINEQTLGKTIGQLKLNVQANFVLLEELTYLFQLKQLLDTTSLTVFASQSKINMLCKRKRERKTIAQPELCTRLKQRLALLDL